MVQIRHLFTSPRFNTELLQEESLSLFNCLRTFMYNLLAIPEVELRENDYFYADKYAQPFYVVFKKNEDIFDKYNKKILENNLFRPTGNTQEYLSKFGIFTSCTYYYPEIDITFDEINKGYEHLYNMRYLDSAQWEFYKRDIANISHEIYLLKHSYNNYWS